MTGQIKILRSNTIPNMQPFCVADPEGFWGRAGLYLSNGIKPWREVLKWNFREPNVQLVRRRAPEHHGKLPGPAPRNPPQTNRLHLGAQRPQAQTAQNHLQTVVRSVCQFANALKAQGVKKGDRVCIYMPMTPELAVAVLACARIGAMHSVVFAGFSAVSLADRIKDAQCIGSADVRLTIPAAQKYSRSNKCGRSYLPSAAILWSHVIVHQNTGDPIAKWWKGAISGGMRP
jgi:hypothetical protein